MPGRRSLQTPHGQRPARFPAATLAKLGGSEDGRQFRQFVRAFVTAIPLLGSGEPACSRIGKLHRVFGLATALEGKDAFRQF